MGWEDILPHWPVVVADLARLYGIDLGSTSSWERPWAPLRRLILGLPSEQPSRLRRVLGGA